MSPDHTEGRASQSSLFLSTHSGLNSVCFRGANLVFVCFMLNQLIPAAQLSWRRSRLALARPSAPQVRAVLLFGCCGLGSLAAN